MVTKLVYPLLVFTGLTVAQLYAQTIEVTATGVGIGTTSPAAKLDVVGGFSHFGFNTVAVPPSDNINGGLALGWNRSNGGAEVNFYNVFDAWGGNNPRAFVFSQKTGAQTYNDLMTITGPGNVGIGTTTPTSKLTVAGDIFSVGGIYASNATGGNVGTNFGAITSSATQSSLYLTRSVGSWSDTWWQWTHDNDSKLKLGFSTVPQAEFSNGLAVFLGNVGIGTSSPGHKLHISGAGADIGITDSSVTTRLIANFATGAGYLETATNHPLFFRINQAVRMTLDTAGNVGIGTSSPGHKLHISGAGADIGITDSSVTTRLIASFAAGGGFVETATNHPLFFRINQAVRMTLDTAGNVGIGTTSPSHKLTVVGSVRASSFVGDVNSYADFVFKPGYKLASLAEVEASINAKGHLPNIPSEAEVKRDGLDVVGMQVKLLQKVEELTLYLVAHDKALQAQKQDLQKLRTENETLLRKLFELEQR
jgi:hypothetical protein